MTPVDISRHKNVKTKIHQTIKNPHKLLLASNATNFIVIVLSCVLFLFDEPITRGTIKRLGGGEGVEAYTWVGAYNWRAKFPRLKGGTLYSVLTCCARVIAIFFCFPVEGHNYSVPNNCVILIIPLGCLRKIEYPIYLVAFQFDFHL